MVFQTMKLQMAPTTVSLMFQPIAEVPAAGQAGSCRTGECRGLLWSSRKATGNSGSLMMCCDAHSVGEPLLLNYGLS